MIPIYWTAVLRGTLSRSPISPRLFAQGFSLFLVVQMEAALSQGFTYISAMRLIILPQAFRIILPP